MIDQINERSKHEEADGSEASWPSLLPWGESAADGRAARPQGADNGATGWRRRPEVVVEARAWRRATRNEAVEPAAAARLDGNDRGAGGCRRRLGAGAPTASVRGGGRRPGDDWCCRGSLRDGWARPTSRRVRMGPPQCSGQGRKGRAPRLWGGRPVAEPPDEPRSRARRLLSFRPDEIDLCGMAGRPVAERTHNAKPVGECTSPTAESRQRLPLRPLPGAPTIQTPDRHHHRQAARLVRGLRRPATLQSSSLGDGAGRLPDAVDPVLLLILSSSAFPRTRETR